MMNVAGESSLVIIGEIPETLQRSCLGLFDSRTKEVNGHVSYQMAGGDSMMWYAGEHWLVGLKGDVGSELGYLKARNGALRPDLIPPGMWEVIDNNNKWYSAPSVECISQADSELFIWPTSPLVASAAYRRSGLGELQKACAQKPEPDEQLMAAHSSNELP